MGLLHDACVEQCVNWRAHLPPPHTRRSHPAPHPRAVTIRPARASTTERFSGLGVTIESIQQLQKAAAVTVAVLTPLLALLTLANAALLPELEMGDTAGATGPRGCLAADRSQLVWRPQHPQQLPLPPLQAAFLMATGRAADGGAW
mgnify:CR=1 FL=1